ncbi:alpha-glucan family phosphorylase [Olivibacter sp. XZL3]|uniref:alpha-glucan family phosphorylase n=1 Tax=Olivibacter sp. XZL3 TaxID=1735116 RepID=UPI001064852F|nr:alpha-glucan family phosphorylase [Olivibacter sp. XZL3]
MAKMKLPVMDISLALSAQKMPTVKSLAKLALDLQWSWNHHADEIWKGMDPVLWDKTHNPWLMLQSLSVEPLKARRKDIEFWNHAQQLATEAIKRNTYTTWFESAHKNSALDCIAYFSMEYMLTESLPIYVGGLGNVAGDQLKAANDLGVPVVAVGLLYQQGYFRQELGLDGRQLVLKPSNDSSQLPVVPVRKENGEWLRIKLNFPNDELWIRVWQAQVGHSRLFLLDTNDPANSPILRSITGEIYGGGMDLRIQQEIVLGIGGYRVLKELDIHPQVCHMNEGHAAFLVLERAREFMSSKKCSFEEALYATRAGNLFTTHTAVSAGFDYYSSDLLKLFLGEYVEQELQTDLSTIENLGKVNPDNPNETFGMAYLAMRGCGAVNAVSRLHSDVSKNLFAPLFPRLPKNEIPIGYVTNGIHLPTWTGRPAKVSWEKNVGKSNLGSGGSDDLSKVSKISAADLWNLRNIQRADLVRAIRTHAPKQFYLIDKIKQQNLKPEEFFDPDVFTLGFARRFVPYKRNSLLLYNEQRLLNILRNHNAPIQIVVAGKAPPFDGGGNDMIKHWIDFIRAHDLETKVIFLSDYDIALAQLMVSGVDVWLNTPRRPWEACGTSGMKILANGGLNISVLDGWWAEAYEPAYGWSIGNGLESSDNDHTDYVEAHELYDLLEEEILPLFYKRDKRGTPLEWVKKIKASMTDLTYRFSATRTVKEYTERFYLPLTKNYLTRASKTAETLRAECLLIKKLKADWGSISIGHVQSRFEDGHLTFSASILLGEVAPYLISVEIYADKANGFDEECREMLLSEVDSASSTASFSLRFSSERPLSDYTLRVVPSEKIVLPNKLEVSLITWND